MGGKENAKISSNDITADNATINSDVLMTSEGYDSNDDIKKGEIELPIEMQYEEVDMKNPKMDPLEWTARKLVPIPRKYYWETQNENLPRKTKAWHNTIYALGRVVSASEYTGEIVADLLGLNQSRFDNVTSMMTDEEWEEARSIQAERKKKREEKRKEMTSKKDREEALNDIG